MDSEKISIWRALSPLDGRYWDRVRALSSYFSEWAWMRYRVMVEVEYFIQLSKLEDGRVPKLTGAELEALRDCYRNFGEEEMARIKAMEGRIRHDVKAVEYFVRECVAERVSDKWVGWVHWGLTSQDVNHMALPLMLRDGVEAEVLRLLDALLKRLRGSARAWRSIVMMGRTHGQPASPTTLGKEIQVFVDRLEEQVGQLRGYRWRAKFGGATGNFNAHVAAMPQVDWRRFGDAFAGEVFGLERLQHTTQITHYDELAELWDIFGRLCTILMDLCRDVWLYIMLEYFVQVVREEEVGSSAMPHKVNPIDFENAEGNLGIARALFRHLSEKLPLSRLQRDLTDSTVVRNVGVAIGHFYLAVKGICTGWDRIRPNEERIASEVKGNYLLLSEAAQTVLRSYGIGDAYERLKGYTRGRQRMGREEWLRWVEALDVDGEAKERLRRLRPEDYIGYAGEE